MAGMTCFDVDHESFSGQRDGDVVILHFKHNQMFLTTDLRQTGALTDFLRRVARDATIKSTAVIGPPAGGGREEYLRFFNRALQPGAPEWITLRLYNAFDSFILGAVNSERAVVAGARGEQPTDYLGLMLACDHRVCSEDLVFVNAHLELGLAPAAGTAFFVAQTLGRDRAMKLLLSADPLPGPRLLELGLVDEVVPPGELEAATIAAAHRYAAAPTGSIAAVKKLLSFVVRDLPSYLSQETAVADRISSDARSHFS